MSIHKYHTEITLSIFNGYTFLLRPADLYKLDQMYEVPEQIHDTSLYFICQRPRVRVAGSSAIEGDFFCVPITIQSQSGAEARTVHVPVSIMPEDTVAIHPEGSGAYVRLESASGELSGQYPLESIAIAEPLQMPELLEAEVIYIGQAQGRDKHRSALDRLRTHETLQKILAQQAQEEHWMEAVLILFTIDAPNLVLFMSNNHSPEIAGEQDDERRIQALDNPPPQSDIVTIAEASLIKYFAPRYNDRYKNTYPHRNHAHLRHAYRWDYLTISMVIDTEPIYLAIRSATRPTQQLHHAQFDLHDPAERMNFFDIMGIPRPE